MVFPSTGDGPAVPQMAAGDVVVVADEEVALGLFEGGWESSSENEDDLRRPAHGNSGRGGMRVTTNGILQCLTYIDNVIVFSVFYLNSI